MKEILVKDKQMKQELSDVYKALLNFVNLDILTDEVKAVLIKLYKDYNSTLVKYNSELVNDECPIVVAGKRYEPTCSKHCKLIEIVTQGFVNIKSSTMFSFFSTLWA